MDTLLQDIRYATRSLRRSPGFALAATVTLAIGIGANTAIFSVVDGVLLRPAPLAGIERLVVVWATDRTSGTTREPAAVPELFDVRQRSRQFDEVAGLIPLEMNLARDGVDPQRVAALAVTANYFSMTGLTPVAGRGFTSDEDRPNGPAVAMISAALARRQFSGRAAVGERIRLNDRETEIVGVLPAGADFGALQVLSAAAYGRGFADRGAGVEVDVWVPGALNPAATRQTHFVFLMGRLAPGAALVAAQQEMTAIASDLEREYPQSNVGRGANVEALDAVVLGPVRPTLYVLAAAVAMVLLVACVNVTNLLLVRATNRTREVTVRAALGAGSGRLTRQFVVEGAVLAAAGTTIGLALAWGATRALVAAAPATIPRAADIGLDMRAVAVTVVLSTVIAIVFGLLPAIHARRLDLQRTLREDGARGATGGRRQQKVRSALVVAELAVATTLMIGAGLLIRSLWQLQAVDPGFASAGVLKAEFQLPTSRYPQNFAVFPNWPERQRFYAEVAGRLMAQPGVVSVALAAANPMDAGFTSSIRVVGREAEASGWPEPSIRTVSAGYFETLRVPLRDGRTFLATDVAAGDPVVVINESANSRYFSGRAALGQQITLWGTSRTVVGIVGNERFKGLAEPPPPAVYLPLDQAPTANAVLVRMGGDASAAAPLVRRVVREVDPQLALFGVQTLDDTIRGTMSERRFTMTVLLVFAAAALVLAVVGVYGVLSYSVVQRTREIGIRVALGADTRSIRGVIVMDGARLAVAGVVVGLLGAAALSGLMRSLLYGVGTRDPATFAGVVVVLTGVAVIACWLPARRASRVDPMVALRAD